MKTLSLAVAAALTIGALSTPAIADKPEAANVSKYGVAVVDIGWVFDNHQAFTAAMNSMKEEMKKIEASLKTRRDAIAKQEAELVKLSETMATTSREYRQAEEALARAKADFNLQMNSLRKDLMTKESQVYFKTYQQVSHAVTTVARQRNIGLVLRFNGDQPNPDNRGDIIKAINNPIWHQDNIDITRYVLDIVNGPGATAPPATAQNQPPVTANPGTYQQ